RWCGTTYVMGGNTCQVGVDCSGFTKGVMSEAFNIELPRNSSDQYEQAGRVVRKADLRRGDLVFFGSSRGTVDHVGIYLGKGLFAHSASSTGVTVSNLNQDYYRNHYHGAKRVLP
ncbi:C40 family peptidase, partial [bacterium]|nr:C40 family peptidase [bacterium]